MPGCREAGDASYAPSAEASGLEVLERLNDLRARIHHERPRASHGLVERLAGDQERAQLRARGGFEPRGLAVVAEEDELVRTPGRALVTEEALSLHHVGERVEVLAERL